MDDSVEAQVELALSIFQSCKYIDLVGFRPSKDLQDLCNLCYLYCLCSDQYSNAKVLSSYASKYSFHFCVTDKSLEYLVSHKMYAQIRILVEQNIYLVMSGMSKLGSKTFSMAEKFVQISDCVDLLTPANNKK
jgi:hypothetical protein